MVDIKQTVLGVLLLLVFWAFQKGYLDSLGTSAWFLGVIIFSVILWLIGRSVMPKPSAEMADLWKFSTLFAIVSTFFISYLGPVLGAVLPAGFTPSLLTPLVLSLWLVVFGGAMFATGWNSKWTITLVTGLIWLFSAVHLQLSTGPNSWLHFGLITGLPFILVGLMAKK